MLAILANMEQLPMATPLYSNDNEKVPVLHGVNICIIYGGDDDETIIILVRFVFKKHRHIYLKKV